jgi:hypothetical protein
VPRQVTLVLQRADGSVVGALPPFAVATPWWQEVESVVAGAAERGADVTVLRMIAVEPDPSDPSGMGGTATYAAELHGAAPPDLAAVDGAMPGLDDHALRLPWARPGGPARELAWAARVLADCGRAATGPPHQMRTWNLSSIWTIPTNLGPVWLKSVPPFFAHEGSVIAWLAQPGLPPLLGHESGRVLMADIPGVDRYDASLPTLQLAVERLVALQARVAARVDELRALGTADWRWPALRPLIDDVVERHRHELEPSEQRAVDRLVGGLDARCAAIDACGLPPTLVHGDFHPGNLRGDDRDLFILDWGDSGVGHPLFDVAAMVERIDSERRTLLMTTWAGAWLDHRPGADPSRAATLIEPVAALRQAVIYRGFLDGIEPSEQVFHARDPALWLRRVAQSHAQDSSPS